MSGSSKVSFYFFGMRVSFRSAKIFAAENAIQEREAKFGMKEGGLIGVGQGNG